MLMLAQIPYPYIHPLHVGLIELLCNESSHFSHHLSLHQSDISKLLYCTIESEKDAYDLYCAYAHQVHFSIWKNHHNYWPNWRKIKSNDFICSKSNCKKSLGVGSQVKFCKADVRTDCSTMIGYIVDKDGYWRIENFIGSHNYDLSKQENLHLLRYSRAITEEKTTMLKLMT